MRLEEYLNSINKKEIIYIFLSIPIVVFIIYYNFIFQSLEKKEKKLLKDEQKVGKELIQISTEIRNIKKSKKDLKPTISKVENLREEFKFLKYSFNEVDLIKLSADKSYLLIKHLLNKANLLNLTTIFKIDWNQQTPPFTQTILIKIDGTGNYINIIKYLQYIENLKSLVKIKSVDISINLKLNSKTKKGKGKNGKEKKDKVVKGEDLEKKVNNLIKFLLNQKMVEKQKRKLKREKSTLSFVLTKYSEKEIIYFKHLAKKDNSFSVSISNHKNNLNYLDVSFAGSFSQIRSLANEIKNKKKRELLDYTNLYMHLVLDPNINKKEKKKNIVQRFTIQLKVVGAK